MDTELVQWKLHSHFVPQIYANVVHIDSDQKNTQIIDIDCQPK